MNTIVLVFLALMWAGGAYSVCRFKIKRERNGHRAASHSLLEYALITMGSGILTAWLIRIVFVPYERWGIGDLSILLILAAGLYLLVKSNHQRTNTLNLLEMLPNQYGVFHLRLEEREHIGLKWAEHTLGELDLRKKNLLVLAIVRDNEMIPFPKGPEMLHHKDDLLIFGSLAELKR